MKILDWQNEIKENELKEVSSCLENGGLVIFPTETVYGLGALATNPKAVDNIFIAKGRANDNPLIVHLDSKEEISTYAEVTNEIERKIIEAVKSCPVLESAKGKNLSLKNLKIIGKENE